MKTKVQIAKVGFLTSTIGIIGCLFVLVNIGLGSRSEYGELVADPLTTTLALILFLFLIVNLVIYILSLISLVKAIKNDNGNKEE